ncbi:unnamed protein product [Symbiodinium sp. CCMP2592]|nr:unnamed protein product [Symbiodinium sp. CCMP2592]
MVLALHHGNLAFGRLWVDSLGRVAVCPVVGKPERSSVPLRFYFLDPTDCFALGGIGQYRASFLRLRTHVLELILSNSALAYAATYLSLINKDLHIRTFYTCTTVRSRLQSEQSIHFEKMCKASPETCHRSRVLQQLETWVQFPAHAQLLFVQKLALELSEQLDVAGAARTPIATSINSRQHSRMLPRCTLPRQMASTVLRAYGALAFVVCWPGALQLWFAKAIAEG